MARRKSSVRTSRGESDDGIDVRGQDVRGQDVRGQDRRGQDPDWGAEGGRSGEPARLPTSTVMGLISVALVLHLFVLLLSYTAIIEPSATHTRLLDAAAPYLRLTHFPADGRPFYLAHGIPDEQPHRLQFASRGSNPSLEIDSQTEWTTVQPSGIAGLASWDRYGRWMKLVGTLAQSDRPSLAAALLMPLISADESIDAVRIIRLPTQLTTAEQDAAPPVYLARVVRDSQEVGLVSIVAKRLSTYPREPVEVQDNGSSTGGSIDNQTQSESVRP